MISLINFSLFRTGRHRARDHIVTTSSRHPQPYTESLHLVLSSGTLLHLDSLTHLVFHGRYSYGVLMGCHILKRLLRLLCEPLHGFKSILMYLFPITFSTDGCYIDFANVRYSTSMIHHSEVWYIYPAKSTRFQLSPSALPQG